MQIKVQLCILNASYVFLAETLLFLIHHSFVVLLLCSSNVGNTDLQVPRSSDEPRVFF